MRIFTARRLSGVVAFGTGVVLVAAVLSTVTASAAFADTVVDGCTIVANPTATHATSCPGANLARADLSGLNLAWANLAGANLYQANLSGTTLAGCTFQLQPLLISCSGARLDGDFLVGANLSGAATSICDSIDYGDDIGSVAYCGGVSLANANLHRADLTGDNLSFVDLAAANLTRGEVAGSPLRGVRGRDQT